MDRIILYLLNIIASVIIGCRGQNIIGPTPSEEGVLIAENHRLACSTGAGIISDISWFEDATPNPILLSVGGNKLNTNEKYNNFAVDINGDQVDLVINDIAVEDEGTYFCQLTGTGESSDSAIRTVEVAYTSIQMTQDGNDASTVEVTAEEQSSIVCTALAGRPVVTIDWYHKTALGSETKITDGVIQTDEPNTGTPDTFDVTSTLTYTSSMEYNQGSLRCVTRGQYNDDTIHVDDSATLNVQYTPIVTVMYANKKVTGTYDANPDVTKHAFFVNGTEYTPDCFDGDCTLTSDIKEEVYITYNATNTIGTGTATILAEPGATKPPPTTTPKPSGSTTGGRCGDAIDTSAIVGGVLGVLLAISIIINVLLVYLLVRRKNSTKKDASERAQSLSEHTSNIPQSYMELDPQTRQNESTYQQPLAKNPDTSQAYMDLNPQTRDDKTAYQELHKNAKAKQGSVTQVYEEIKDDKTTKQQDKEPQTYANVQPN